MTASKATVVLYCHVPRPTIGISIGPLTPDIGTVGYVGGSARALSVAIATSVACMMQTPEYSRALVWPVATNP